MLSFVKKMRGMLSSNRGMFPEVSGIFWKYNAEDVGWRASCSNAQAFANRMSRASVTGANGNARMSANPFETESI